MLSQKAKYALRALLMLAQEEEGKPVLISEIADRQKVPRKFLELILLDLKHHGLLHSQRGRNGGYLLAKKPADISFAQVIRIMDGPLALVPCVSKMAYRRCPDCEDETACAVRRVLLEVRNATARILEETSLSDALTHVPVFVSLEAGGEL